MLSNSIAAVLFLLACFTLLAAQSTTEKSHVERFSTVEVRAERSESDANARLQTNPNDDVALNVRALARFRLGRTKEAYDDLSRAVALKPDRSEYHANLGYALWKLGKFEDAIKAQRTALKIDDKNTAAHYQLGRFLLRLGRKEDLNEAISELKRALELDPRQYEVRFELIAAYRELGNLAEAAAQLDVLQDSRPTDPRVLRNGFARH